MKIEQTKDFELVAQLNKPVHDLHCSLYPKYFREYNYEEVKALFKQLMKNRDFTFFLVKEDKEALGYAWVEKRHYRGNVFNKEYKSIYVHQISINQSKRKKGYGTLLMEEIYQFAHKQAIDLIELDYWVDNQIAKGFYKKQQFIKYREFVYKQVNESSSHNTNEK